jgi:hypothetical protein
MADLRQVRLLQVAPSQVNFRSNGSEGLHPWKTPQKSQASGSTDEIPWIAETSGSPW